MTHGRLTPVVLALLVLFMLISRPRAQCQADDNYWLFQHTTFRGVHWMRTLQEHSVSIADEVCALDIQRVAMAGVHPLNYAVASTPAGALHLIRVRWIRPSTICALPTLRADAPVPIPLPPDAGVSFHLVNHASYAADSLLLAVVEDSLLVRVHTIRTSRVAVLRSTDLVLTAANTGQAAIALAGDADTLGGIDRGLWVLGSGGLLRRIAFDGAAWGAEQVYDVDSAYTVQSFGEGFAGTHDGTILALGGGDTFSVDSRPASDAILRISRQGAVGESGCVLVHSGTEWHRYTSGTASYRRFNFVSHTDGSSVELLDAAWGYRLFTYADSATRFVGSLPAEVLAGHVNGAPYALDGVAGVKLRVADPDSNHTPPSAILDGTHNLLVNAAGDTLGQRRTDLVSTYGVTQFAGDTVELRSSGSRITLRALSLRAAPKPGCATSFWKADTFEVSYDWNWWDTLVVALSGDTLRFVNQGPTVAPLSQKVTAPAVSHVLRLRAGGRTWTASLPRPLDELVRVELFDAVGRMVGRADARALGTGTLPLDPSVRAPCLLVRARFSDGAQVVRRMILTP